MYLLSTFPVLSQYVSSTFQVLSRYFLGTFLLLLPSLVPCRAWRRGAPQVTGGPWTVWPSSRPGDWRPLYTVALQPTRFGHCSLEVGQALVVVGGYSTQYLATVEGLGQDLAWQALPGLKTARSGHTCAAIEGGISPGPNSAHKSMCVCSKPHICVSSVLACAPCHIFALVCAPPMILHHKQCSSHSALQYRLRRVKSSSNT